MTIGCFEEGYAYPDNDLDKIKDSTSAEQCQQICQETAGCVGFTFRKGEQRKKNCYIKHTFEERKPADGAISGPPSCGIFPSTFQYIIL